MQPATDLAVTATGGAVWLASELYGKRALAPLNCNWCDLDTSGAYRLNGFDRFGLGAAWSNQNQATAAKISDMLAYVALPASMVGLDALVAHQDGALSRAPNDLLIMAEAVAMAGIVNQTVKFAVRRERPFVHALDPSQQALTGDPNDNNLSFYSGHTSMTFSLATAAGTVASLRGYKYAWVVWAVGMPMAAATGYLRMAADKHYLSDVLVGAVVGSAFGAGVPLLLHSRIGRLQVGSVDMRVTPSANGVGLVGSF
jgi:membrane-associated phospholipid phosphatase